MPSPNTVTKKLNPAIVPTGLCLSNRLRPERATKDNSAT